VSNAPSKPVSFSRPKVGYFSNRPRIVQKIKRWKPMSKRPIGRPKIRWEDDVLEDIKCLNIRNWKKVAQKRGSSKKVVEQAGTWWWW